VPRGAYRITRLAGKRIWRITGQEASATNKEGRLIMRRLCCVAGRDARMFPKTSLGDGFPLTGD